MYHIAILKPKYFNMILNGTKPIESRFSINKIAPYGVVSVGDVIYLKKTGCAVSNRCKVKRVEYFNLTPQVVEDIRLKYGELIGTSEPKDWESTKQKKYGTLIWIENVESIQPINVPRSNGNAWFVLDAELK